MTKSGLVAQFVMRACALIRERGDLPEADVVAEAHSARIKLWRRNPVGKR